jgi:hypothetical protein
LNLSHNSIVHLPDSIGKLLVLNILHSGFNPISDRAEFFRLTRNLNLSNLDLEGSPVSCEAESLLIAVSSLPQLTILNRKIASSDDCRKPRGRFCRSLSQHPQQCSAEVAALQLQNETLVAQQRAEIAAARSDCEARKPRWKSEVHELRSKIRSLQAEMQTKDKSARDDDRRTPTDLSLIKYFSDAIQSESLRQCRFYSLTSSVPSAELPIKQCYLMLVQTFNEIMEHFPLRLAAAGKQSSSAECHEVVETSAGTNEIVRAKLREMKKEKSALIAKVHDTSEHFRELELKLSREQKLVAESRAAILEQ